MSWDLEANGWAVRLPGGSRVGKKGSRVDKKGQRPRSKLEAALMHDAAVCKAHSRLRATTTISQPVYNYLEGGVLNQNRFEHQLRHHSSSSSPTLLPPDFGRLSQEHHQLTLIIHDVVHILRSRLPCRSAPFRSGNARADAADVDVLTAVRLAAPF